MSKMKSTGIMRKVDELGRIVLPKELRNALDIKEKDPLEIFVGDRGEIILRKYQPACIFCNSMENIRTFKGHNVCRDCMQKMSKYMNEDD
jgi:transcriptional pleiotropic regulator of transition state genes